MLLAVSLCIPTQAAYANPLEDAGNAIASFFGLNDAEAQAAYDESATADGASYTQWEKYLTDSNGQSSTQNIGRIWTDKTVSADENGITLTPVGINMPKGDSDFLVMLSALSSTSNLTTTSDKPLDIVLVLDRSGSMADDLVTYTYSETYNVNTDGWATYYAKVGNSYVEVDRVTGWWNRFDHWELNGQTVEPMTSSSDTTEGHIQFYTRSQQGSGSKMDALKAAANSFIDATATQNETITDTSKQHRISIVSYSSSASTQTGYRELTAVSGQGTTNLQNTVNGLWANGGTQADDGMRLAQTVMNNARDNAQKVILFFTDGEPGDYGFTDSVANAAIQTAKTLKDDGTLIYSVGVLDDADTSVTNDEINAYMHGVSSNYPDATAYNNLGDRATDKDGKPTEYYKAASSADDLNSIFSQIAAEVSSLNTGEPTHVEGDDPAHSGYLTFYDELGSYMEVDSFTKIVLADQEFTLPQNGKTTNGNIDTYTFTGMTEPNDPDTNVANIVITVERSGDADSAAKKQGDKVTVKVPAALIPLRNFDVDTENDTTTLKVTEEYPIRIAYGVSLKDDVDELIQSQDEVMQSYINENTDSGKVAFYSNAYSKGAANGLTTATFDPATSNSFYTFTTDTQLYTDAQCQNKATGTLDAKNNSYWYQRSYYVQGANNTAELKTEIIELKPDTPSVLTVGDYVVTSDDGTYIKAGSPRLQRVNVDTVGTKDNNATGTATNIINPVWATGGTAGYTQIEVHLGNNGKITKELPGALEITKDVKIPTGFDETAFAGKEFEFTVKLEDTNGNPVSGDFSAAITNTQGVTNETVTFANGSYTCKLKDGEKIAILGLSKDTQYTVTETPIDYFDTAVVAEDGTETAANVATGAIVANATASADFVNTYKANPAKLSDKGLIEAQKILDKRAWTADDSFEMWLTAEGNAPLPAGEQVSDGTRYVAINMTEAAQTQSFGDIEYTVPGTYRYEVVEKTPNNRQPGMSYSQALYDVVVEVEDNHEGTLSVTSVTMTQYTDDNGQLSPTGTTAATAVFTNTFQTDAVTANVNGWKRYTDNSGENPLTSDKFTFEMQATGDNAADAPVPSGATKGQPFTFGNSEGGSIDFPLITFTSDSDDGKTYTYTVREVIPDGATEANGYVFEGMKYDPTVWTVTATVSVDTESGALEVAWSIMNNDPNATGTHEYVVFNNSYTPTPITLEDDTDATIHGAKTLTGRNALDTEKFEFTIEGANQETDDAIADQTVTFGDTDLATEVSGPGAIDNARFDFGSVTFTKPGTYVFDINEKRPAEANASNGYKHNGITYDTHTCQVTVTVTDEKKDGTLAASVSYYGDQLFTNAYTASVDYGANAKLFVAKTLNGRDMAENEFQFTIKDSEGTVVDQTTNDASANGVQVGMEMLRNLKFDQSQVGNAYTYVVDETEPKDDNAEKAGIQSKGVTYDQSQYRIDILVGDNYDGTLNTTTTVTRVMDASGNAGSTVEEILGTYTTNQEIPDGLVAFVNSYQADSISTVVPEVPMNKVLMGRNWLSTDQFLFDVSKVSYNGSAMQSALDQMPNIASPIKVTQANADEFNLGSVEFTHAGEYVYQVVEQNAGTTVDGITYSGNVVEITVVVKDDAETGKLVVESANITRGEQTFTNSFSSEFNFSDAVNFQLSKTLNGRDMEQGKFNFTVTADDEEDAEKIQLPAGTLSVNVPGAAGTDGETVTMPNGGDIIFNHSVEKDADGNYVIVTDSEKTFKYTFNEVIPDDAVNPSVGNGETPYKDAGDAQNTAGWTKDGYKYDSSVYTLTITPVMHPETGKWEITTTLDKTLNGSTEAVASGVWNQNVDTSTKITAPADFVNSYAAAETDPFTPTIQKKVVGKDAAEGAFDFILGGADDFTNNAIRDGHVVFTSHADRALAMYASSPAITNGATETISFSDIKFTKATEGDNYYTFNVIEVDGGTTADGWALDGHTYTIKVKVTDVNGKLVAEQVDKVENADLFTNTYGAVVTGDGVSTDNMFTKTFTGRDWTENDNFTFNITSKTEGAPMPVKDGVECTQVTVNGANDTNGSQKFGFGTISFTYDDIKDVAWEADGTRSKTFVYEVSEVIPENVADRLAGVTYSTNVATLTIKLTDDGKGNVTASELTTVARAENGEFFNRYNSNLDFDGLRGGFDIVKTLTGRLIEIDQFGFKVTAADDDSAALLGVSTKGTEYKNTTGGGYNVTVIGPMAMRDLTQDDAGKTFQYTVQEIIPTTATGNYGYDDTVYTVKISVEDDGAGNLKATTQVLDESGMSVSEQVLTSNDTTQPRPVATFNNTYASNPVIIGERADVSINASKTYNGGALSGNDFGFTITDVNGAPVATGTNDANGHIAFSDIEYTLDKLTEDVASGAATVDKTTNFPDYVYSYVYTVSENAVPADNGITVNAGSFAITVQVTDDADGNLSAKVVYPEGSGDNLSFVNTYGAGESTTLAFLGSKALVPSDDLKDTDYKLPNIAGKYSFELTGSEGAPMPDVTTATNDAAGNVSFGDVEFVLTDIFDGVPSQPDVQRQKTFTYTVKETGTVDGVDNDADKTFTVTVTDLGGGKMSVTSDPATGAKFAFTNVYSVDPVDSSVTADGGFQITKDYNGPDGDMVLQGGEFKFVMTDAAGNEVASGVNDANGKVEMSAITFTKPGSFDYTLSEVVLTNTDNGITYDTATYKVTAGVADNGDGTLTVTWAVTKEGSHVEKDGIIFENTYEPAATSVTFGANKKLEGGTVEDGQFEFQVRNEAGDVVATAKNNASGTVIFPAVKFTKAGTYTYTVVEKNDGQEGVTYDTTQYEATVTVTDDGQGHLSASVAYANDKDPVFVNTYTAPEEPTKPGDPEPPALPDTSDNLGPLVIGLGALAVIACAGLVIGAVKMRRKPGAHRMK